MHYQEIADGNMPPNNTFKLTSGHLKCPDFFVFSANRKELIHNIAFGVDNFLPLLKVSTCPKYFRIANLMKIIFRLAD